MRPTKEILIDEGDLVYYFKNLRLMTGEVAQVYPRAVFVNHEMIPIEFVYLKRSQAIGAIIEAAQELALTMYVSPLMDPKITNKEEEE